MKEINIDVLKDAANRLYFTMSDEEYATLLEEFKIMIKQMRLIGGIEDIDDVAPMTFPFSVSTSEMREDISSNILATSVALRNATDVKDNQIKLPKVVK
ncbi:MAG: hypothetical protein RSA18_02590 [Bacilli bacterium]